MMGVYTDQQQQQYISLQHCCLGAKLKQSETDDLLMEVTSAEANELLQ
jgi:hypothetical protein